MGCRIGLLARADNGGLGSQTYDFYQHMKPAKTLVVNLDMLTGYTSDFNKYPDAQVVDCPMFEIPEAALDSFLKDIDVVFTVECPYNHALYTMARERGIKTICQYNWEWLAQHEDPSLPHPDLYLASSGWHKWEMDKFKVPVKYLHVPVDRKQFPFKLRHTARKFLHIAGHSAAAADRNGTATVLEALPFIQSQVEIVIRTQDTLPRPYTDHRLTIIKDDPSDRRDLFQDEDVLLLPRRYGGLSLQLNEALSLGMVPIMTDQRPQNSFLDQDCLVPITSREILQIKTKIDVNSCSPQDLAAKIDERAGRDLTELSKRSNYLASLRSWKIMKPQYEELLCSIL